MPVASHNDHACWRIRDTGQNSISDIDILSLNDFYLNPYAMTVKVTADFNAAIYLFFRGLSIGGDKQLDGLGFF